MMQAIAVKTDFPRKVREIENTWIPMPDGTRLAARIWLPEDAEDNPVPAILEYLPYRKRDGTVERDHLTHPYFAGHGYAGVRVDMRGSGDSEGVCLGEYLLQEQDDALAVIDWLAAQPWCSGKVGMIGISWGGFNGLQVAARQPKALGAVISLCSTDDRYADDIHFMGGAMLTDKLAWGATAFAIANTPPDPEIVGDRWRDMWVERLENNGLWFLDWVRHQRRDDLYRHGSICEDYAAVQVPVYAVGGYADGYTNPIFRMMQNLSCPRKALVGPWAHKYPHFATPEPRIGFLQECLRWWDQHLKGIDTGIMEEPMIRAWVQEPTAPSPESTERPGRWISEAGWPSAATRETVLHVTPDGLSETASDAAVQIDCPENAGHAAQTWCMYGADPDGPLDQNREAGRMAFFETAPLDQDLEIFGFPMLHVKVASDVPQANLAAVLSLVAPDGRATLVSFGTLNLTHRNGHTTPEPLPPGQAVEAVLQLNVIGQRIPAGYRLRLALSQAYWPLIFPSPQKARLTLTKARLVLPSHDPAQDGPALAPFGPPEGAAPLEAEVLRSGSGHRTLTLDYPTGLETYTRYGDTGESLHKHTGITVHYENEDRFEIHPDDPNSARATCRWTKHYRRDDWLAELDASVTVEALRDVWRVTARLEARDANGTVLARDWNEDIPRDHV
ncbi:CocE/NonD family hydrolase [Mameliella alba]|nr:CocE/NonD family hydrolase [Mameliella alba]MBY6176734.1 CocE/NonD family hydrolase [Mameliella alba]